MKRYILALIASVCIITPAFAWTADTSWGTNYNSATSFTISTAGQLAQLAAMVNSGSDFAGKTITLSNDINLSSQEWTPIGNASRPFRGVFDGANHTISNISITAYYSDNVGFFGYVAYSYYPSPFPAISNVKLSALNISASKLNYIGGLIGQLNGQVPVTNCSVSGKIANPKTQNGQSNTYVGGLIGYWSSAYDNVAISGCTTSVQITSSYDSYVGGILGYSSGIYGSSISGCASTGSISGYQNVGGIIGCFENGTVTLSQCYVSGSVSSSNNYCGGLAGQMSASSTLTNCYTTCTVSSSGNYAGGLIGSYAAYGGGISGCYTTGTITGSGSYTGGFIGTYSQSAAIANSYTTGTVSSSSSNTGGFIGGSSGSGSISNCYTTGNTTGATSNAGGFIGTATGSETIDYCYTSGNVSSTATNTGGFIGNHAGSTKISNSFTTGNVTSTKTNTGGFVGSASNSGPISNCYTVGQVNSSASNTGGFVGSVSSSTAFSSCYSTSTVAGTSSVGGFAGNISNWTSTSDCYAAGNVRGSSSTNGFVGTCSGLNGTNSYYDFQTTGQSSSGYSSISGLSTTSLCSQNLNNFTTTTGYYPQLTTLSGSTDTKTKAWSALSVVPLFLTDADDANNLTSSITAPLSSAASVSADLSWIGAPQSGDTGLLNFIFNNGEFIYPVTTGTYTFTATDQGGYVKYFAVTIKTPAFKRYFVQPSGSDSNNGSAFANNSAFKTLQKALESCTVTDCVYEIWVGKGTYIPTKTISGATTPASSLTFGLKRKVLILGGFAGTETVSSESTAASTIQNRQIKTNATVLSGNSVSASVVNYGSGDISSALLDGFSIISCNTGSGFAATIPTNATIQNCKILRNTGNGLSLANGADAYNMLIADNTGMGASLGGATSKLINATIANNGDVAITSASSSATVTNSILWNNTGGNISGTTPNITYSAASSQYMAGYESNIWNANSATTHNIELYQRSPNFNDATNSTVSSRNYELLLISPCLAAGNSSANDILLDANGAARTYNSDIDLGAFQKADGYIITGSTLSKFRAPSVTPTQSNLSGSEVMINPGGVLNLTSTITPSVLIINDDNIQAAPIIAGSSLTATKVYYAKNFTRYRTDVNTQAWNVFAVPFSVTINQIDGGVEQNTILIGQYNEQTRATSGANRSAWEYLATSATLNPNKGYMLQLNAAVPSSTSNLSTTIIFPSSGSVTFNNSTMDYTGLTNSTSTYWYDKGWNFISNPSAQTVTFANASGYWPYGLSDSGVNGYAGGVYFYRPDGDYYDVIPLSIISASGISPYTSFFVKSTTLTKVRFTKTGSGSSPVKTMRFNAVSAASALDATTDSVSIFNLHAENSDKQTGDAYVIFHPQAHSEIEDIEDSPNMSAVSSGSNIVVNTFATNDNTGLGINSLPFSGSSVKIPISISVPKDGSYTLTLPIKDENKLVYFEDTTGIYHDLSAGYSFTANSATTTNAHIVFVAKNPDQTTSDPGKIRLVQIENVGVITGTDTILKIAIYTENGTLIKIINNPASYSPFALPTQTGLYLVQINTGQETVTKKVIIH